MRPFAVYIFPNLRFLSITFEELLNPDAPIRAAVRTCASLYGQPHLYPIAVVPLNLIELARRIQ